MIKIYKIISGKYDSLAAPVLPRQIRALQEDMILDYKKVQRSMTYVNSFSLIEWSSGIFTGV